MNLGLGNSAGIGDNRRCLAIVWSHISLPGKFKGKLTNGFLANVYSPVSQKEQVKTMKERKECCML